jgi:uncharacterized membrane protein
MNDNRLDIIISNLLRTGVLAALVVVAAGGVFKLIRHGGDIETFSTFQKGDGGLSTVGGIAHSVMALQSDGLIQAGLLILIATPVARVALAAIGFALEGDKLYVLVSLTVLAILAFSILHAV